MIDVPFLTLEASEILLVARFADVLDDRYPIPVPPFSLKWEKSRLTAKANKTTPVAAKESLASPLISAADSTMFEANVRTNCVKEVGICGELTKTMMTAIVSPIARPRPGPKPQKCRFSPQRERL